MPTITAPITGLVWEVLVAEDDAVEVEQVVIVLESMKLEIPVESEHAGTVRGSPSPRATPSTRATSSSSWPEPPPLRGADGGARRRDAIQEADPPRLVPTAGGLSAVSRTAGLSATPRTP